MSIEPRVFLLAIGLGAGGYMLGMLLWSIVRPEKRIWPPDQATTAIKIRVWIFTTLIFASAFVLGVLDWDHFELPAWVRWAAGLVLIAIGNFVVWHGVHEIGLAATSGEATGLKTDGFYRWSRNPQYVADMVILIGWGVLSASVWALPVIVLGIAVLLIAPFAEEPWLNDKYGQVYREYARTVRRYL